MKTLTIKAPWAWCIFHAGKNIENRTWKTDYRGPLLIHMAKTCNKTEWSSANEIAKKLINTNVPEVKNLPVGFIYGVVDLVDIAYSKTGDDSWGMREQYHWKFSNPRLIKQVFYTGALQLWEVADTGINFDTSSNPLVLKHGYKARLGGLPRGEWFVRVYPHEVNIGTYSYQLNINGHPMVNPRNGGHRHGAYRTTNEALQAGIAEVFK